jgi:L-amino acid N-acyltransferase YncA
LTKAEVIQEWFRSQRSRGGGAGQAGASVLLRELAPNDWDSVTRIYAAGIATGNATFETDVPPWEAWDAAHLPAHRFVAVDGSAVVGWIALSPYSSRECYAGVAQVGVYVDADARGRGVGRLLLEAVVASSEEAGIWTLQAGVMAENAASLALHRGCGFRVVGIRERIGKLNGEWRDVVLLERRAPL